MKEGLVIMVTWSLRQLRYEGDIKAQPGKCRELELAQYTFKPARG